MTATTPRSGYLSFPENRNQNAWLDLVRALAIMLVLFRHGERAIAASASTELSGAAPSILHTIFLNGWVGVDLFLVLSGYLISRSLIGASRPDTLVNLVRYARARILRIVPAYLAVLACIVAGLFPFYAFSNEDLVRRIGYHLLFLQDYLPADINVVFWSLGVEEKFYLLAPGLIFVVLKLRSTTLALALLAALFLVSPAFKLVAFTNLDAAPEYDAYFRQFRSPFHVSLEPLIAGVIIGYLRARSILTLTPGSAATLLLGSLILMTGLLASHDFHERFTIYDVTLQPVLVAILFGCMVLGAASMPNTMTPPANASFRTMSRLSYSLYLVHFPLIPLAAVLTNQMHLPAMAFWINYLAISFMAACLLHFLVEKPFLIVKDHGFRTALGRLPYVRALARQPG